MEAQLQHHLLVGEHVADAIAHQRQELHGAIQADALHLRFTEIETLNTSK